MFGRDNKKLCLISIAQRLKEYEEQKNNVKEGNTNCIPLPFKGFRKEWAGLEMSKYYLISANTKGGKSILAIFLFIIKSLEWAKQTGNPVKIFYFSLEMSSRIILDKITSYWLYTYAEDHPIISSDILNSLDENNPLPDSVLSILQNDSNYQEFIKFFEEHCEIIEDIANPFGMFNHCQKYALANGKLVYIDKVFTVDGHTEVKKVVDYYLPDNKKEYKIVIVDHLSLISPEKGASIKESIDKWSSDYCVRKLRNLYGFTICNIQQQALAKSDNDSFKLDRLAPSPDGLAESKLTSRDCDMMIGLFNPFFFKKKSYEGYDISKFKNAIRFMEIVLNRNGRIGGICPLMFNGAATFFRELPAADNDSIKKYENLVQEFN